VHRDAEPIVFEVVPEYVRDGFDPEAQATTATLSIPVQGDANGPTFDATQYSVRSPGRMAIDGPGLESERVPE
jgi:hypothetical protein